MIIGTKIPSPEWDMLSNLRILLRRETVKESPDRIIVKGLVILIDQVSECLDRGIKL